MARHDAQLNNSPEVIARNLMDFSMGLSEGQFNQAMDAYKALPDYVPFCVTQQVFQLGVTFQAMYEKQRR